MKVHWHEQIGDMLPHDWNNPFPRPRIALPEYKVLQDIKAFEVIASSAGFDFNKYVMLKKGEIIQGEISTYMTGYGTKTAFLFERGGRDYKIDGSLVSEISSGSGGFKLGSDDIDGGGINKASVTVPMLILGGVLLVMFFNQRKK